MQFITREPLNQFKRKQLLIIHKRLEVLTVSLTTLIVPPLDPLSLTRPVYYEPYIYIDTYSINVNAKGQVVWLNTHCSILINQAESPSTHPDDNGIKCYCVSFKRIRLLDG